MAVYVFNASGQCLEVNRTTPPPNDAAFRANCGQDCIIHRPEADPFPGSGKDDVVATIDPETGEVTAVEAAPEEPVNEIWLHVALSGGDGDNPIGIANSGETEREAGAAFALRATQDPASPVITQASDSFRMRLRDKTTRACRLIKRVEMVEGEGSVTFSVANGTPGQELVLDEDDFVPVAGNRVRLAQPVEIVVFEP